MDGKTLDSGSFALHGGSCEDEPAVTLKLKNQKMKEKKICNQDKRK